MLVSRLPFVPDSTSEVSHLLEDVRTFGKKVKEFRERCSNWFHFASTDDVKMLHDLKAEMETLKTEQRKLDATRKTTIPSILVSIQA